MRMLEEAPSHPRHNEENEAAADDQALPAEPERRPQDDGERGNRMQPIGGDGGACDDRRRTKLRNRPKYSPDARQQGIEPEEQPGLEGRQRVHSAADTAATAGTRRPKVRTSQTSTT